MKIKFILWIDFTFLSFPFLPQHISIIVPILRSWTRGGSQPATIQRKWHGELCRSALLPVPAGKVSPAQRRPANNPRRWTVYRKDKKPALLILLPQGVRGRRAPAGRSGGRQMISPYCWIRPCRRRSSSHGHGNPSGGDGDHANKLL